MISSFKLSGLKELLVNTILLGTIALINGCATTEGCTKATPLEITAAQVQSYRAEVHKKSVDPFQYLQYFKENEFIVPDAVFESYVRAIGADKGKVVSQEGGYFSINYLFTQERRESFQKELEPLGLEADVVGYYNKLFTSSGVIIFRESLLENERIKEGLPHERFHEEIKKLSNEDKAYLFSVAENLLRRNYSLDEARKKPEWFYSIEIDATEHGWDLIGKEMAKEDSKSSFEEREKEWKSLNLVKAKDTGGMSSMFELYARLNFEEFYTYLMTEKYLPRAEQALQELYPRAYQLYSSIKNRTKDLTGYDPNTTRIQLIDPLDVDPLMLLPFDIDAFKQSCLERGLEKETFFFTLGDNPLLQIIKQIEKETNSSYTYADTTNPEEQLQSGRKGVVSQISPVLIHDCKVYWGTPPKPEETYRGILSINPQ